MTFAANVYSKVKLFVFAMNSRKRYFVFACLIHGLEEKNSKSEIILVSAVNVMLFDNRDSRSLSPTQLVM